MPLAATRGICEGLTDAAANMKNSKTKSSKSKATPLDKLIAAATAKRNRETVEKGRALKRLGLYEPKSLAVKTLTPSQRRTIDAKFKALQSEKYYTRGVSHSPLVMDEKGKYKLSQYFSLVRTKKKDVEQKSGVTKTKNGLLVSHPGTVKMRIDRKGRLLEVDKAKGMEKRFRRLRNGDLIKFLERGARGELKGKFPKGTRFILHRWGGNQGLHYREINPEIPGDFADVYKYETQFAGMLTNYAAKVYSQSTYLEQLRFKDLD